MFVSPTSQGIGGKSTPDHSATRHTSADVLDVLPKLGQHGVTPNTSTTKITSITPSILTAKITDATSESVIAARTAAQQSAADTLISAHKEAAET